MIAKSPVAITDAIDSRTVGGGGVFVHFDKISEKSAQVYVETEIQNDNTRSESVTVETTFTDAEGNVIKRTSGKLSLNSGEKKSIRQQMEVKNPKLWSPESPFLYDISYRIVNAKGEVLDEVNSYAGMRKVHIEGNRIYLNLSLIHI